MNGLEKSILKTIIWFDMFDFPLTLREIYGLGFKTHDLKENKLDEFVSDLIDKGDLGKEGDLYFSPGREKIVATRKERYQESLKKIKLAQKASRILSILPHVKAVILCNVLGYLNAKKEDDVDFLIITSKNRIWTVRFFSAGIFKIFGLRANPKGRTRDRFCFSFYAAEDGMNLENLKLKNDPYFVWWFCGLLPIYDQKDYFEKFLKANEWVKKYLPNFNMGDLSSNKKFQIKACLPWIKIFLEKMILNFDEKMYKKLQLKIMPRALKDKMNKSCGVVVSDQVLKFHLYDKREEFATEFEEKVNSLFCHFDRVTSKIF